jgi:hypothetical protein
MHFTTSLNPLYQMSDIKRRVIENLKLTKFMGIANRFLLFWFFLVKKGSADDEAFVWDRGH